MNAETINFQTQRFPVTTFAAANFAQHFAYSGFSSAAMLFLMNSHFADNRELFVEVYSLIPLIISLLSIPGGIISDFLLGSRRAVIAGSVLQCLGYLIMSVPDKTVFIFGIGILMIGSALYSPNFYSLLGIVSRKDNKTTEGTVLIQLAAGGCAGFLATILFNVFSQDSWFFICLFVGIFSLVPALLFFFTKNMWLTNISTVNYKLSENTNTPTSNFPILIATVVAGFCFTVMYGYGSSDFLAQFSEVSHHKNIFRNIPAIEGFAYLTIATLFGIIWHFFKFSPYIKLFLGFALYSFILYSFNSVKNLPPDLMVFVTVQLLVVLQVICELLITPTITALLLDKAPIKLLSTYVAVYMCLFHIISRIIPSFKYSLNLIGLTQQHLLMAGLSVLLALLSILHYINKKKAQSLPLA
ncbi:MAG: hypothetical protein IT236_15445 [Bacteroidia bacterium]|nr:hypothetical protein [Bacteroidia bacterium]